MANTQLWSLRLFSLCNFHDAEVSGTNAAISICGWTDGYGAHSEIVHSIDLIWRRPDSLDSKTDFVFE